MRSKVRREHLEELARAVLRLERAGLAGKYSNLAGGGFDRAIYALPKPLKRRVNRSIEKSVAYCIRFIVRPASQTKPRRPRRKVGLLLAGIGGGISGALGVTGIFLELPVITTLILQTIAETALYYGEDLTKLEGRLACVEVLALGARPAANPARTGYFSTRAKLARLAGNSSYFFLERGVSSASASVVNRLFTEAAGRLGFALSERLAVGTLPVVGAAAGGVVSIMLLRHFQNIATAHFTVRKLERMYGVDIIRRHYLDMHEIQKARRKAFFRFL
ncbi:MAG: EcsC family protein [Methylocystis sp.]